MEIPDPQYLKTQDGVYIAYQVMGDGPVDIAWQLGDGTNTNRLVPVRLTGISNVRAIASCASANTGANSPP